MGRLSFSHPVTRAAFCLFLLALPLISLWNVVVSSGHPALAVKIGPKLAGVTYDAPVDWSWTSIRDGSFQKAIAARVTDAMPVRPLLIRINNEIRFELFGALTAPSVVRGINGQLIERSYLDEYCSRVEGEGERIAQDMIPKLLDIQNYYRNRGGVFVYVVSPSKAAHFPEYFLDHFACPSSTTARAQLVAQYVERLKQEGIHVVDTASLIHSLKGAYDIDLFPQGGVHWNDLGAARAAAEIVGEIDRQAGRELVPRLRSPTRFPA